MKYIIKKGIYFIFTMFFVSAAAFLAFRVIPGDSALVALGTEATREQLEELRKSHGLDKNIPAAYLDWLAGAAAGDFGTSLSYQMPVKELIGGRFFVTLSVGLIALVLIAAVSLPLGILSAKKQGGAGGRIITLLNQTGMAIPPFFMGILITLLFGVVLRWFQPGNYVPFSQSHWGYFRYMIFPAAAVAVPKIAMMVKFLRSSIIRQMDQDYVRTARSKGNKENAVLYRHVLKNAMIPVATFFAMIAADVLAGSIIIEQVFSLPGLGRLLVVSISNRDFPVVQAIVLYIAGLVILTNFLVDMLYRYLDPRIQSSR